MKPSHMIPAILFATLLGLSACGVSACALDVEDTKSLPETAALEDESSSVPANVTEIEEKDYEEIAKAEGRKDWTLAIEKSRKVLTELHPDVEFRAAQLDDEMMENKLHQYKILFRSETKSCVVTVKQEAEDKFTVEEGGDSNEKAICTEDEN